MGMLTMRRNFFLRTLSKASYSAWQHKRNEIILACVTPSALRSCCNCCTLCPHHSCVHRFRGARAYQEAAIGQISTVPSLRSVSSAQSSDGGSLPSTPVNSSYVKRPTPFVRDHSTSTAHMPPPRPRIQSPLPSRAYH